MVLNLNEEGELEDMETMISSAIQKRIDYIKEKAEAESFTHMKFRRLIEEDLGLEIFALDIHKTFIKKCMDECLNVAENDNVSQNSKVIHLSKELQPEQEVKNESDEEEIKEGSLVPTGSEAEEVEGVQVEELPNEETIKEALEKRASYFRTNGQTLTMVGVRRLLEEDMQLAKFSLDPYKKFISGELDVVLNAESEPESVAKKKPPPKSSQKKPVTKVSRKKCSESEESEDEVEPTSAAKRKRPTKVSQKKRVSKISRMESSDSEEIGDDDEEVKEEKVKPQKKLVSKGKAQKTIERKSIKRPVQEIKTPSSKKKRVTKPMSDGSGDENAGSASEDGQSESSVEEPVKKREVSTPAYGKRVEHLRSVIKSCGLSIAPHVYVRAKQAPNGKREEHLTKELTEILKKEGLSTNPSEKEIKACKKRKQTTKELEGIDMSNIVSSSRRRSTSSYTAPPKPISPVESESESESEDDSDDEDDESKKGSDDDSKDDNLDEEAEGEESD